MDLEEAIDEESLSREAKIARDSMERYSGSKITDFGSYVLLTNFPRYVQYFAQSRGVKVIEGSAFRVAHCRKEDISILDFKMGSPMAALVVDLCAFLPIRATLMLGMCGGLRRRYQVGDYFAPIASIRGEGTSDFYFPPEVPAMANFLVQRAVSQVLDDTKARYHVGITHTTNIRFWEFNEQFKERLKTTRAQTIEMECATLFSAGYSHRLPVGALLLVSDLPFEMEGVKTKQSSQFVFDNFTVDHIEKGVLIMKHLHTMQQHNAPNMFRPRQMQIPIKKRDHK